MKREKKHYSREFKIKAVELSNQQGSLQGVAEELSISKDNLKRWKKEWKECFILNQKKMKKVNKHQTKSKKKIITHLYLLQ